LRVIRDPEAEKSNQGISETFEYQMPGTNGAWRRVTTSSVVEVAKKIKKFIHRTGSKRRDDEHMV
jgi:hypothetical protein